MVFHFVLAAVVVAAAADRLPAHHQPVYHSTPVYAHPTPAYGHSTPAYGHPTPAYGHSTPVYGHPTPAYGHSTPAYGHSTPAYGHSTPAYGKHQPSYGCPHYPEKPKCSAKSADPWCLEDSEYPEYDIKFAIKEHKDKVLTMYADLAELDTDNSVDRLKKLVEETYLCPSEVAYVRPLRAVNTDGKWRVIVNNIKVDYQTFTQTARIEKCLSAGENCPLVPHCYGSSCLQKSVYHRFLVYDPCDQYFPFAIETFQLPSACACTLGAYEITH